MLVAAHQHQSAGILVEDEVGDVQDIPQGEGGDQGDPLMPLLFSLAMHPSLVSTGDLLGEGEKLFAFLDDVYLIFREGVGGFPSHRERTVDPLQDQRAYAKPQWDHTQRMRGSYLNCPGFEPR